MRKSNSSEDFSTVRNRARFAGDRRCCEPVGAVASAIDAGAAR